jgi:hypothetical protein
VAAAFGGLVVGATRAWAGTGEEISHTAEAIHMKPVFKASRKRELMEQSSGTKIVFDHTGFPKGQAEHLAEGWKGNYWEPLEKFLV